MSSDMKAYLASKYMSGAKADAILARSSDQGRRKKKRKVDVDNVMVSEGTMGIVDEDGGRWGGVVADDDENDGDTPVITQEKKTFQKTTANWNTLDSKSALPIASGSGSPPSSSSRSPMVKEEADEDALPSSSPKTKKKGGLMTAADIAAEQAELQREREAQEAFKREQEGHDEDGNAIAGPSTDREQETVYRTAQGQKIDLKAEKAEQKRREREEREKEAERMEWGKGLVQRKEKEEKAVRERDMAKQGVARYADDRQLNEELRQTEHWDDPAAAFLTKKKVRGPQKPKYKGHWPPNRFNIPPGYRWDGVDRSTGFESKMFQKQNEMARRQLEKNAWSMEDM